MGQVVKRFDILKSTAVAQDMGHDHKLWWINVEMTDDGRYQVVSYAQLFSVGQASIDAQELRRYPMDIQATEQRAIEVATQRITKKLQENKGYNFFKKRDAGDITVSQEDIIKFLKTYSSVAS